MAAARYATDWQPPAAFEWRDLAYEVLGPDAVVVTGLFAWTRRTSGAPNVQSYAALLRRHPGGGLRIRVEAEAGRPRVPWAPLAAVMSLVAGVGVAVGWHLGRRRARRRPAPAPGPAAAGA